MQIVSAQLRRDASDIWQAGVAAVDSERLVAETLRVEGNELIIGPQRLPIETIGRILVVGAGKAGAGMAAAVEAALGPRLIDEKRLAGWVNVPADCVRPLGRIKLHAARPAGQRTHARGRRRHGRDPPPGRRLASRGLVPLPDFWRWFGAAAGAAGHYPGRQVVADPPSQRRRADIAELNAVRKQLSRIKGGGLARAAAPDD